MMISEPPTISAPPEPNEVDLGGDTDGETDGEVDEPQSVVYGEDAHSLSDAESTIGSESNDATENIMDRLSIAGVKHSDDLPLNYDSDTEEPHPAYPMNMHQRLARAREASSLTSFHPECIVPSIEEVLLRCSVTRAPNGHPTDDRHTTTPILTKYERAKVLGARAEQINSGAPSLVRVPQHMIDGYDIAEIELKEGKLPFIIRRPLPDGNSEYWHINDLEVLY